MLKLNIRGNDCRVGLQLQLEGFRVAASPVVAVQNQRGKAPTRGIVGSLVQCCRKISLAKIAVVQCSFEPLRSTSKGLLSIPRQGTRLAACGPGYTRSRSQSQARRGTFTIDCAIHHCILQPTVIAFRHRERKRKMKNGVWTLRGHRSE